MNRRDFFRRGFRPENEPMGNDLTLSRREFSFLMLFTFLFASMFKAVLDLFAEPKPVFNPEIITRTVYGRLKWASPVEEDLRAARAQFALNFNAFALHGRFPAPK